MGKILGLALVLWAGVANAATWTLVTNQDCTGFRAATVTVSAGVTQAASGVNCCTGVKAGFCGKRMNFGDLFEVITYAVANGNYTGAAGDTVSAAKLAKLGLANLVYASCNPVVDDQATTATAAMVVLSRVNNATNPALVQLFDSAGVPHGTSSISGWSFNCIVYGY